MRVQSGKLAYGEWRGGVNWREASTAANVNDGDWYHVAAVREGGANSPVRLYIDGALASVGTVHDDEPNRGNRLMIGALFTNGNLQNRFDGLIDDLGIWSQQPPAEPVA